MHILGLVIGTFRVCALSASLVRSFIFVMPLFRNKPERVLPLDAGRRVLSSPKCSRTCKKLSQGSSALAKSLSGLVSLYLVPSCCHSSSLHALCLSALLSLPLPLSLALCCSLCCREDVDLVFLNSCNCQQLRGRSRDCDI